jgi:hypothetical protein
MYQPHYKKKIVYDIRRVENSIYAYYEKRKLHFILFLKDAYAFLK